MSVNLYPFYLSFSGNHTAFLPMFFNNEPVKEISCSISHYDAGDMGIREYERRRNFIKSINIDPEKLFACSQTHSRKIVVIDKLSSFSDLPEADGLVTALSSVCLSVTVADCLPVYLFDTKSKIFGVVHSGWKGTGIVCDALKLMNPESVCAVLGPCICKDCYAVDEERIRWFEANFGGSGGEYPLGYVIKKNCLDLHAANARLLANMGVKNIACCQNCTFTDKNLGSFRREGKQFTRMIALIGNILQ